MVFSSFLEEEKDDDLDRDGFGQLQHRVSRFSGRGGFGARLIGG